MCGGGKEYTDSLSSKENVPGAAGSKEGHADSIQGHERTND